MSIHAHRRQHHHSDMRTSGSLSMFGGNNQPFDSGKVHAGKKRRHRGRQEKGRPEGHIASQLLRVQTATRH